MNRNLSIGQLIEQQKRLLSGESLKDLRKAARKCNVTQDSLIWILTDVFQNGQMRSNAYSDCPQCVILDGLVVPFSESTLEYVPWRFTEKAKDILNKRKDA